MNKDLKREINLLVSMCQTALLYEERNKAIEYMEDAIKAAYYGGYATGLKEKTRYTRSDKDL